MNGATLGTWRLYKSEMEKQFLKADSFLGMPVATEELLCVDYHHNLVANIFRMFLDALTMIVILSIILLSCCNGGV